MVLVGIRLNISGDEAKARAYIWQAKSQLNILHHQMSFQNLKQGVRRLQLSADTWLECLSCFGQDTIKIMSLPDVSADIIAEVNALTVTILPSSLAEAEEAVITVTGGVYPYAIVIVPSEIGFVLPTPIEGTDNTFTFVGDTIGSAEIIANDASGLTGTAYVTVDSDICCDREDNLVINGCMELEIGWFISDWGYIIDPELCPSPEYSAEEYYEGTRSILCTAEPNGSSGNYYFHSFYVQNVPIEVTGTYTVSLKYKIVSLPTPADLETPHDSHFATNCILRDENAIFIENVWLPPETTVDYDEVVSEWVEISGDILAEAGTNLEISFGVNAFSDDTTRPEVYIDNVCCFIPFSIETSSTIVNVDSELYIYITGGVAPYTFSISPGLGRFQRGLEEYEFYATSEGQGVITCTDSTGRTATAGIEVFESSHCYVSCAAGVFYTRFGQHSVRIHNAANSADYYFYTSRATPSINFSSSLRYYTGAGNAGLATRGLEVELNSARTTLRIHTNTYFDATHRFALCGFHFLLQVGF